MISFRSKDLEESIIAEVAEYSVRVTDVLTQKTALRVTDVLTHPGNLCPETCHIVSNIVEGFGRRRYKAEFIQFLTYAVASCDETKVHLEMLHETKSLKDDTFNKLSTEYDGLCAKLYRFREAVVKNHKTS